MRGIGGASSLSLSNRDRAGKELVGAHLMSMSMVTGSVRRVCAAGTEVSVVRAL